MDKDWIPIIGTLLGVLFGGGVSSFAKWVELRHQRKEEKRKQMLSKLEELYEIASRYMESCTNYTINLVHLRHLGNVSGDVDLEKILKNLENITQPLARINTLLKIYAPELEQKWNELTNSVNELQQKGFAHLQTKNQVDEILQSFNQKVIDKCQNLLESIEKKTEQIIN